MVLFSSRKGAKDAKIFQNISFALLAAWREKIITQEVNDISQRRKGRQDTFRMSPLRSWRLGEKYITQEVIIFAKAQRGDLILQFLFSFILSRSI